MKAHLQTLIVWAMVTAFAVQESAAFTVVITVPFVFVYLVVRLCQVLCKKWAFRDLGLTLSIIAVSYLIVGAVHVVRFNEARQRADALLAQVQAYKARHGVYPASVVELGITPAQEKRQDLFYRLGAQGPALFYHATQVPFDVYTYDFEHSRWEYDPD